MRQEHLIEDISVVGDLDQPKLSGSECEGVRSVYLETYGCQMNVSDSEIVASVLREGGYGLTHDVDSADVILLNTCAIRDNAEKKVRHRLSTLRARKLKDRPDLTLGVLGCMAERLRTKLLEEEKLVDIVAGPDAYRDLPNLLHQVDESGQAAVNVQLSREETYADIAPVRYDSNGVSAFVSIMRGCDNMCSFCVVPFTRGRERSRPVASIVEECTRLFESGYREVTVLGQNVNSYRFQSDGSLVLFPELLSRISDVSPDLRIRYSTSHPKDCSDELLHVHREKDNVCNYIHLPVQHGNTDMLQRMRRSYTREEYLGLIERTRTIVPDVALSTDIIAGFCDETDEEHDDTLSLMELVGYDHAYMFMYSERPGTYAQRKYTDSVPLELKKKRLSEIIALQNSISERRNKDEEGRTHRVLVEGVSRKSNEQLKGRTDTNKTVVFDRGGIQPGEYVDIRINGSTSATLFGSVVSQPATFSHG